MACSFDQQVKNGIVNAVAQEATDTGMFTRDNDTLIVINKDGNFRGPISLINDKYGEEIIKEIDNTFLIEPSQNLVDQYIQARNEDYLLRVEEIADSIGGVYGTLLKSDPYPTLKEIAEHS